MISEITEWTFAADFAKWVANYLAQQRLPFKDAQVETKSPGSAKRRDFVLYASDGRKALTGEIKFPESPEGQTPFNSREVLNARRKARRAGVPYFFTWNVNSFVLWQTEAEHETRVYHVVAVRKGAETQQPGIQKRIREEFIPRFLGDLADLVTCGEPPGVLPLDKRFVHRLDAALQSLALVVQDEALARYKSHRPFRDNIRSWMRDQGWLVSDDPKAVTENLDRLCRLACYVGVNRLVFYQALRRSRRFRLPRLEIPSHVDTADRLRDHFAGMFHEAKEVTHDYQTILDFDHIDRIPFLADGVVERWRFLVALLNQFDFRQFDQDVIGHIFEELLGPEEKHRWGQHYTRTEIVDLIHAFCIRKPDAVVLDPASGSGTFAVRAYARKKCLARGGAKHADLLRQVYACEISEYAAHLTALNLATRDLIDGENFPRVARKDFFETRRDEPFSTLPASTSERKRHGDEVAVEDVWLRQADAITGNPPYVRQEEMPKRYKKDLMALVTREWPGLKLSGRSDMHVYFWPHACALLPDGGYFGFITSSSWLDVEYGFHLQRWILQNFELVAVLESTCEPWFTGARVATAVTILRRCADASARNRNVVRFVQLRKPLAELMEHDGTEPGRQEAAERLRNLIEQAPDDVRSAYCRILCVPQARLWDEGCRVPLNAEEEDDEAEEDTGANGFLRETASGYTSRREYYGSKWGVYLRAPDYYFDFIKAHGSSWAPLGEMAEVRYGFKSGCDPFFVLKDITEEALSGEPDPAEFRTRYRCARRSVEKGDLRIGRSGDGTEHAIETPFLVPEIHSLMHIDGVRIETADTAHRLLKVEAPKTDIKAKHLLDYLRYGEREHLGGDSPVDKRPTCLPRKPWYNVESVTGTIILPVLNKYRHLAPWNVSNLPVNHALMVVECNDPARNKALAAVLNSTLVAFIKPYYSRNVGTEAHTQLDVYAAKMMPVPNVLTLSVETVERLGQGFDALGGRPVTHLVEQRLLDVQRLSDLKDQTAEPQALPLELQREDRRALDTEVLRAVGVSEKDLPVVLDRLYREVARYFNAGRILELQANENKKRSKKGRVATPHEVALEILDDLDPHTLRRFPADFLPADEPLDTVELFEGKPQLFDATDFYDAHTLRMGRERKSLRTREQAELAKLHCNLHKTGFVRLPVAAESCCRMRQEWEAYEKRQRQIFRELAAERSDDEEGVEAVVEDLFRVMLHSD